MAEPAHVLVFDSGVGALSIIREIRKLVPQCSISYGSDTAFFPYGNKPETELVERVDAVLKAMEVRCKPDIIVVACNTASTVALPKIRDHFKIPTVGVVPAIRPAAQRSQSKVIGLLATPGTVARDYTHQLIKDFASDCTVISVGSSELVQQAERKLRGLSIDQNLIDEWVSRLWLQPKGDQIDTIVLACTHFPLLLPELANTSRANITWIDSGEAIARRVQYWIGENNLPLMGEPSFRTIMTSNTDNIEDLAAYLDKLLPGPMETITVPGIMR